MSGRADTDEMMDLPEDKDAQEGAVLASLVACLDGRGLSALICERPDRIAEASRRFAEVTCDALVEIVGDAHLWAVDVMVVPNHIALSKVSEMLQDRFDALAAEENVSLTFEGSLPDLTEVDAVTARTAQAVAGNVYGSAEVSPGLTVAWEPASEATPAGADGIVWLNQSPLLVDQVREAIAAPLTAKATKQARRGREAGCRTAVLLDQVGHAGVLQGTQWLPRRATTFATAVSEVLDAVPGHALDAVLLRDRADGWHLLCGEFPGF